MNIFATDAPRPLSSKDGVSVFVPVVRDSRESRFRSTSRSSSWRRAVNLNPGVSS